MKGLFILLIFVLLAGCNPAESNRRQDLEDLTQSLISFNNAFREGNLQVLDSLTTADYQHTNGNSKAFGKESWFNYLENRSNQLAQGALEISEYELIETDITLHGTSGIVTGLIITAGKLEGEPFVRQIRVSNVWVKEEGIWKRAAFHDTPLE